MKYNKMKKILLLIFVLSIYIPTTNAQHKKGRERIRAYKISFITEKLNLTPDEAENFWPIYNIYDKKMMSLHREERFNIKRKISEKGGIEEFSEKEAKGMLLKIKNISEQRHNIKANFQNQVSKILSYKKILILEITEHEFNRKLIRKLKNHNRKTKGSSK